MGFQPGKPSNEPTNYFAFAKQSGKAVEGTTFYFPKHLDGTGFEVEAEIQREREGGDGQEVGLTYRSMIRGDGALVAAARSQYEGRCWAGVLGSDAIASAGVASLARHTAAPVASLPYFTFEQRFYDEIERVVDGVFTGLTFEGEPGRPWRTTVNFISGGTVYQRDIASTLTPVREQGKPFFYPLGSYVFDGGASYGGDVTKIRIEVTRNVDDGIQTVGINRDDVVPLNFDVTVDATIKYTSRDFYQKVSYNSGSQIVSQLPTGSIDLTMHQQVQVASGVAASGQHRIVMPLLEWTDARVNKLNPDGQTAYLDLVGMTVKGATSPIFAVTDNGDIAAY
jgi:tail tube protein